MGLRHDQRSLKICMVCRAYSMRVKCVGGVWSSDHARSGGIANTWIYPIQTLRSSSLLSLCVPNRKTGMAKSKSFSSVASSVLNKLPGHLSSIFTLSAFRKRLKHHLFLSAFPGNPSPSTGITFCDVSPSTDMTQVRHTPPPG